MTQELDIAASWAVVEGVLVEYLTCLSVPVVWLDETASYNVFVRLRRPLRHNGVAYTDVGNETEWSTHDASGCASPPHTREWLYGEARERVCCWVRVNDGLLQERAAAWATDYHRRGADCAASNLAHYEQHAADARRRLAEHKTALAELGLVQKWVRQ
jgi:hypothetical protein